MKTIINKLMLMIRHQQKKPESSLSPWEKILSANVGNLEKIRVPGKGQKILCATSVGSNDVVTCIDSLVAMGLWVRGAEPIFLLCDEILPACEAVMFYGLPSMDQFLQDGPKNYLCKGCFKSGSSFYKPLPIPTYKYSDFINQKEIIYFQNLTNKLSIEACFDYTNNGMLLGEQTRAGVLRFFGKADLSTEDPKIVEKVARRYLAGALISAAVMEKAIDQLQPECVVAHHGIYVPQGVIGVVARKKGVRVVNWGPSYRNTTVIYSHGDTYHHTFMNEPTQNWENRVLNDCENRKLDDYLRLRRDGKGDWSWVTPERGLIVTDENQKLALGIGLDLSRPVFGLLTNVLWDAQLFYSNMAFSNMLDWLFYTFDFFIEHPELQLIVRIHPHEVKHGNRQPTAPEIAHKYPLLPKNIKIINGNDPYSTYALMDLCQAVLIYGTKTGVELTPLGQPVITAGEAWIRNKGITFDAKSREEYREILNHLPEIKPLSSDIIARARRYAYHYFFRRMIPFSSLDPNTNYPPKINIFNLSNILPEQDRGLDLVCEGILTGKEFIYDY